MTVVVTGHSLGSAVSTLALYRLKTLGFNVGRSYIFESPRVGNEAFERAFLALFEDPVPLFRITHAQDPYIHLPPSFLLGYHNVGSEAFYPVSESDKNSTNPLEHVVCLKS